MSNSEMVIEGIPRPRILRSLREVWSYRSTMVAFAERNIRLKYKQTILGIAWAVIQPLTFMAIFTLALGRAANVSGGGVPYAAFSLSVLVAWSFLSTSLTFGGNSLLQDATLLRKVYFPREVPVLGAILGSSVDLGIALVLFFILGPFLGAVVSWTWLLVPLLAAVLALLASGVSLTIAALNVYYRDFRHALPFITQLWLFASPIAYPLETIPEQWRLTYVLLNPAAGVLDGFRTTLALGQAPDWGLLGISVAGSLVVAALGYRIFKSLEPNFADVV